MAIKTAHFSGTIHVISMSLSSGTDPWGRNSSAITGSWITGSVSESIVRICESTASIDAFGKEYFEYVLAQPTSSLGWGFSSGSLTAINMHVVGNYIDEYDENGEPVSGSFRESYDRELVYEITLPEDWRDQVPTFSPDVR